VSARRLVMALLVAAVILPSAAGSEPEDPTTVFDWSANMTPWGYSPRPNPFPGVYNSDLAFWGDRAYQGTYDGFRIVDISNPHDPRTLIDYAECFGNQGDVVVWDDLLIRSWNDPAPGGATCDGEPVTPGWEGIHIFDVSDPSDPDLLASVRTPCGSHTATGVPDVKHKRFLVYVSAVSEACEWFDIVEVPLRDPASATLLQPAMAQRHCHDTGVVLGAAMLAACSGHDGFSVFSLGGSRGGSLTKPKFLYSQVVPGVSIGHSASFSWDGRVLVFGHEPGGGAQALCQEFSNPNDRTMFFYRPTTGELLGRWVLDRPQSPEENCTVHNYNVVPTASGRVLVSGNYQAGTRAVDFSNARDPKGIAFADPIPLRPRALGGDWSSYWYDGYVYESDITRGLLVWKLDHPLVKDAMKLGHLNPQTVEFTIR
jgi:hypothetical protein